MLGKAWKIPSKLAICRDVVGFCCCGSLGDLLYCRLLDKGLSVHLAAM